MSWRSSRHDRKLTRSLRDSGARRWILFKERGAGSGEGCRERAPQRHVAAVLSVWLCTLRVQLRGNLQDLQVLVTPVTSDLMLGKKKPLQFSYSCHFGFEASLVLPRMPLCMLMLLPALMPAHQPVCLMSADRTSD